MNIVVFGAGAIGSLFGALLSKENNVVLIGRKPHVDAINKNGIEIKSKTNIKTKIQVYDDIKNIESPDLLIVSVKAYDTEKAMAQAKKLIGEKTVVMSVQNGLDNIEKIKKYLPRDRILVCITTHGAVFSKPGVIIHTGIGKTIIGELNDELANNVQTVVKMFNDAGIKTSVSNNIVREIWIKGIINSSINPLTTFFNCKNGYLLENPILERLVEKICEESTSIASSNDIDLSYDEMIMRTKEVINDTAENYSSMLQSRQKGKKTEIESINGKLVKIGNTHKVPANLNEILLRLIKSL
jgi:2-dehydropantoate 2-reductase